MKAKATVEPSNILSFFEEFAENQRMPYVMLMVVYMLSTRRINLKANFLDHFYVEDDEKFASAIREMMKEVQDLLSPLSLGRKQIIENILAILLPGYEKENFLALSKQIFCAMGFPFLKNKAIKTIGKDNNFHEVLDSYTKDKKLNKDNKRLQNKDKVMSLLLKAYQANIDIIELPDDQLNIFIDLVSVNQAMMLALIRLTQILPQTEVKLMGGIKYFFANSIYTLDIEQYSSLNKIFEVYPAFIDEFREGNFFQQLVTQKKNGETSLNKLVTNCGDAKLKFLAQLLFNENQASSWLNSEFVQALNAPISFNDDQYNFSALTSLLSKPEGRDFAEKMFAIEPKLLNYISSDVFYRSMYSPHAIWHNWSAFSMLVIDFCAKPSTDGLLFSFYKHNPTLKVNLSYEALCAELKGGMGYMGLQYGERCTVLGLLVAQYNKQRIGIELLAELLTLNPDTRKQISVKDLFTTQQIGEYRFNVYEDLSKDEIGCKLLTQLTEENPDLQAEIDAEIESKKTSSMEEKQQECIIS